MTQARQRHFRQCPAGADPGLRRCARHRTGHAPAAQRPVRGGVRSTHRAALAAGDHHVPRHVLPAGRRAVRPQARAAAAPPDLRWGSADRRSRRGPGRGRSRAGDPLPATPAHTSRAGTTRDRTVGTLRLAFEHAVTSRREVLPGGCGRFPAGSRSGRSAAGSARSVPRCGCGARCSRWRAPS